MKNIRVIYKKNENVEIHQKCIVLLILYYTLYA